MLAADSSPRGLKQGLAQPHAFEGEAGEERQEKGSGRLWDLQGAEDGAELRKEAGVLEAEGITPKGGMRCLERQRGQHAWSRQSNQSKKLFPK